jgi:hypothetical protein
MIVATDRPLSVQGETPMTKHILSAALLAASLGLAPALAQNGSATAGSGGTASVGGTSASTLGVGATDRSGATALGMGASGAATDGNVKTRAAVHGNNNLNGQAMAKAQDGGTFSKSHTTCHGDAGDSISCRTKSMAHEPGSAPVKSSSSATATIPQ